MIVPAYPKFPAKNLQELIATAKQKPGTINFAGPVERRRREDRSESTVA